MTSVIQNVDGTHTAPKVVRTRERRTEDPQKVRHSMNSQPLQIGTLVIQPKRPEWGPGKIAKFDGKRAYVVWRDLPDRAAKVMDASFLERSPVQKDDILDNLPPLIEKEGQLLLPKTRVTFKQAVEKFFAYFPLGFEDPKFL